MIGLVRERILTAFSDLNFDRVRHLYFVNGDNYISTSKLVESHSEEVDFEKILPYSAIKEKTTVNELRTRWHKINSDACELGHNTHDFLEAYNGIQIPRNAWEKAGIKFLIEILKEYDIVAKEIRMYSRKFRYAGTADLLLRHRTTGALILADYKTNADLFKCYKGKTLLEPFDYLEDCPYNHYQLQLSYYQILLETSNISINDRMLIHLKPDETYRIYNTYDLTDYLTEYLTTKKQLILN